MTSRQPLDLCDAGETARALTSWAKPGSMSEIQLCGHHTETNFDALMDQGFMMLRDERRPPLPVRKVGASL